MNDLKRETNTGIALITHDMGVVARMCDRVVVMRHGKIVETGTTDDIFYNPSNGLKNSFDNGSFNQTVIINNKLKNQQNTMMIEEREDVSMIEGELPVLPTQATMANQ